ncbi:MAG: beta-carotene 15,15-monooxygenase [Bacteroidetes bacterium]|nr:beta-carotene 15,15-monooxygenase [Bacteroidota bacterium]
MFNFFKSNNPALAAVNVVLIILFRIVFLIHPTDTAFLFHHAEPASKFFIRLLDLTHMPTLWLAIAGGVLCFIESLLVNRIINRHKVSARKNYIGGILFVIFSSMVPACQLLSPALVSIFFTLLILDKMFDLSRPEKLYGAIFDLGFLAAIAMLFYFPAVYLLLLVIIGFLTMRTGTLRGILIIFTGFLAVMLVVFTVYFWKDALPQMLPDMVNLSYRIPMSKISFTIWQEISIGWIALIGAWILLNVPAILYSSVIQTRKYITVLILSGVFSFLAIPLLFNLNLTHLLFALTSMTILGAVYFVETKATLIAEVLFIVLILSVFALEYLPLFIPL